VINRVENVALPYLNSPNYDYGTTVADVSSGNEIFENVMQKAAISSLLNDSQDQGSASGGSENTSGQDDGSRYSEDLRKAWETLRSQEETFYRTREAARRARKPIPTTESSDSGAAGTESIFAASAASAANGATAALSQSQLTSGASNAAAADSSYAVSSDGTVMMEQIFQKAAAKYGVSSNLLKAVAKEESGYQPGVVSYAGAIGVMQLMPGTASSLGVTNPYDAEQNIMGGAKMLSQLLAKYNNNLDLALAAYNAGPGNVARYGGAPPYTRQYISAIKAIMNNGEQTINVPVTIASTAGESATAASETAGTAAAQTTAGTANTTSSAGQTSADSALSTLSSLLGTDNTSALSALASLSGSGSSSGTGLYQILSALAGASGTTGGSSSSVSGSSLGDLARLAELQTLNSAASTLSSFGSDDDDDNSLI